MFLGISKKGCSAVKAFFIWGPQRCGQLTRRRIKLDGEWIPVCKDCQKMANIVDVREEAVPDASDRSFTREVGSHESLYSKETNPFYDRYDEVALSECAFGCKIYKNSVTGERVLAHNSAYGCDK